MHYLFSAFTGWKSSHY